ncbi:MAG: hypothetical protein IK000_00455 [Bacteroidaceae bacterium]|nr:hypothetical protein [Bacteroidaceae bacterium]
MAMCYKEFVDYIIPTIGLIVSIVACFFTYFTYRKSRDILKVVDEERKYRWNKKELETLFSTIPIDSIESFFETPDFIRDELWEGLRAINLRTFQYNGKEHDLIAKFIKELDSFCYLRYKQVPSGHWKFQPFAESEPFDANEESRKIEELLAKARRLRPLFNEVKDVLMKYHVDIRDINRNAYDSYSKSK